ncbi:UNVERIFIED_CONTAM: hypothetical protein GTU68_031758 [Idotea baltica]|nr:hypothetical protein [Idotea baltica]
MPNALAPWLSDSGSLTRRLKRYNQTDFSVQLLGNSWIKPLTDESLALNLPLSELSYQREVLLMDGEQANVYARTIVPRSTYMRMQHRFNNLGNTPLGELLFAAANVRRGPIQIACLRPGQWLYEMALSTGAERPDCLWGRRSQFYISGQPLLVNEIFLPPLQRR